MRKGTSHNLGQCRLFVLLLSVSLFVGTVSMNESYSFSPGNLPSTLTEPYVRSYKLYSRCSYKFVTIRFKRRDVYAKSKSSSKYAKLLIESVDHKGTIKIRSETTGRYLCFNARGKLIVRHHGHSLQCSFRENITKDNYTKFQSVANPLWYVGFRRNGKPAKGYRGNRREKCYQFVKKETPNGFFLGLDKLKVTDFHKLGLKTRRLDTKRKRLDYKTRRRGARGRFHKRKSV